LRTHLRILGWLYVVVCGLLLAAGVTLCALLALDKSSSGQKALQFLAPPILLLACFVLLPGLVGGIGLLASRRWARTLLLLLSAFLLLLLPLGTALAVYSFWVLWNAETYTPSAGAERLVAAPIVPAPSPSLQLLGVMACVAAGFFLVLKIGFILHIDPQPAPIDSPALTVAAVLVLLAGMVAATFSAVRAVGDAATRSRLGKDSEQWASTHHEARRRRVAELAADPARARYAPLVEQGEDWSDENIAYDQNPHLTVTCEHLQPIERAIRRARIPTKRYSTNAVMATCRIDLPVLQRAFPIATPVRYAEFYHGDRDSCERPAAFLICDAHSSLIHTRHPDESTAETPVFPTAESRLGDV
jgi:hypothetical protein